jgi:DNA-binding response OmpR family regulator
MSNLRQKLTQVAADRDVQIGTVRGVGYRLLRGAESGAADTRPTAGRE